MSRIGRQPQVGGRRKLLNEQQEREICNMVIANNAITLRQIRNAILLDNVMFQNINSISISTIDRVLKKHQMTMKQIYRVPFERNSDRVKELRYQYVHEVQTFLSLVAEERIQRELDGATRNEKVFQEVAKLLAAHGYHRTYKQCRDKLKKMKSDYRGIKDHNSRSGSNRRSWKWFDQMDAIYGGRPTSKGREGALDSATPLLLENTIEDGTLCFYNA
ncbi:uncharacterized protein LOC128510924 [Clarias gariepinus]|uniref:uncharacterized protein LOC128510924 n=1 Tax=Clarias gariepinus TaxID=13013 RepID=UPI00234DF298|nr:uncharacterized protein LOC128510924 [Clarias gariepinus]